MGKQLIRLNVLLQELGVASRRKCDELIEQGTVKVNGKIINKLGAKVESGSEISVNGKILKGAPPKVTYIFHKPFMTITSRKDEKNRPTIFELPELKKLSLNVQSVGRLDYRSEGLLVLTNDGALALALSHPKFSVEKTYAVLLSSAVTIEEAEKLRKGVELDDGPAKAISVKIGTKEQLGNSTGQWVELVVTEGRNRLIRRMMEALGLSVVRLVRIAIGDLRLPAKLEAGKLRSVTDQEAKYLNDIKKEMIHLEPKKKKSFSPLSKEVLEIRKIKRKMKLNDSDYAREAERRDMRAVQLAKARKKAMEEKKAERRAAWENSEKNEGHFKKAHLEKTNETKEFKEKKTSHRITQKNNKNVKDINKKYNKNEEKKIKTDSSDEKRKKSNSKKR